MAQQKYNQMATNYSEINLSTAAVKGDAFVSHKIVLDCGELEQKRHTISVERERVPDTKGRIRRYVESNIWYRNLRVSTANVQLTYFQAHRLYTITF